MMMRHYYAIVYAYGRHAVVGNRADRIYRFESIPARIKFLDEQESTGYGADALSASHPKVKRALRYAAQGGQWPQVV
jgi:hypothetical protein